MKKSILSHFIVSHDPNDSMIQSTIVLEPSALIGFEIDGINPGQPLPQNFYWTLRYFCPIDILKNHFPDIVDRVEQMARSGPGIYADNENDQFHRVRLDPQPRQLLDLIDPITNATVRDLLHVDPNNVDLFPGLNVQLINGQWVVDDQQKTDVPLVFVHLCNSIYLISLSSAADSAFMLKHAKNIADHIVKNAPAIGESIIRKTRSHFGHMSNDYESPVLKNLELDPDFDIESIIVDVATIKLELIEYNNPEQLALSRLVNEIGRGLIVQPNAPK